jgi:5-methylcytosine-specific restriction endonuclease McrA
MREHLKPRLKDETRIFGQLERELVYHRDKKQCQVPGCGAEVLWSEAEFHHVEEHSRGGTTAIDNGALVHKGCHPKSAKEVARFAAEWKKKLGSKVS